MTALFMSAAVVASFAAAQLVLASRHSRARGPLALGLAVLVGGAGLALAPLVLDMTTGAWLAFGGAALACALSAVVGALQIQRSVRESDQLATKLAVLEEEQRRYVDEASSHLEASRARFRALTEASPLGILEFDLEGRCTYASRRWEQLTGLGRQQAMGSGWLLAVHEDERAEVERDWLASVARRERFERDLILALQVEGGPRLGLLLVAPKQHRADDAPGFIGTLADVTEKLRGESQRRLLEERVREAERLESLGVLAGGIAHDFNNLVLGIQGNLEVLPNRLAAGQDVTVQLARVNEAAQRAAELASQLLAFSGRGSTVREPVDLSELVDGMAPLVDFARAEHVELEKTLDRELPPIEGDPSQVRQVVMNLLTNAFAACAEGGQRVEVRTSSRRFGREELVAETLHGGGASERCVLGAPLEPGEYVVLEVEDDGCGLEPGTAERIFDPFFTTGRGGRGLGLAVVHGVVRRLRGAIEVESEPGRGTRFRVLFPASARPHPSRRQVSCAGEGISPGSEGRQRTE